MDPDEIDDPDLRAAIKASLRDVQDDGAGPSSSQGPSKDVVDLTFDSGDESDIEEVFPKSNAVIGADTDDEADQADEDMNASDDDEEIKRAIAMSLQDQHPIAAAPKEEPPAETVTTQLSTQPPTQQSPPLGLLGLNRKQMEEERLARLAKRKADSSASPSAPSPAKKIARIEDGRFVTDSPSDKKATNPSSTVTLPLASSSKPSPSGLQWPLGVVKKTYLKKSPDGNDITLEDVLQRGDLSLAVMSSYLWDMDWLFTKVDTKRTRFILIMSAKEQALRDQMTQETSGMPNLRLCFPPMEGQVNIMHSKLMLLFHPNYLRIVVPTANLTMSDWGEDGLMENTVFLIDLPKKGEGATDTKTFFYDELVYFLQASTLNENIIAKMNDFDFTETGRYAFIHSIGGNSGVHADERWRRTGYCGLGRAVKFLGLQSFSPVKLDYVASSIGSLNSDFLRSIYLAFKGDDGLSDYMIRYSKSLSLPTDNEHKLMIKADKEWEGSFHVYFPSDETARAAHRHPEQTAGTVCFQSKWWDGAKFPKEVMRDCVSERSVLMHNKLAYVWPSEPIALPNDLECKGWAYVGSANLSESAWGRLTKDRESNAPRITCRNWECGVLVPVTAPAGSSSKSMQTNAMRTKEIFRNVVPVPMQLPTPHLTNDRRPWFFMGDE